MAAVYLDKIDVESTDKINESEEDVIRHLWNRAHIKTLKLAALIAVGVNPIHPVITLSMVMWAYKLVSNDIYNLTKRFETGEIGRSCEESRQLQDITRIILEYFVRDYSEVEKYGVYEDVYNFRIIPYSYIHRRLVSLSSFRNDQKNATAAIKRTIETLVESGELAKVSPSQLFEKVKKRGFAYVLCDPEMFFHKHAPQVQSIASAPKSPWSTN
jgi:PP-loop superfamily ATP-utilizing enzyme